MFTVYSKVKWGYAHTYARTHIPVGLTRRLPLLAAAAAAVPRVCRGVRIIILLYIGVNENDR